MIFAPFAYKQQVVSTPSVITDNLKFYVDAGNVSSYPGSGTTWTDLSGLGNNFTLQNGPTFDSANGGSIVFDGTNDRAAGSSYALGSSYTVDCWFKTSTAGTRALIGQKNSNGIYFGTRPSGGTTKLGLSGQFDVPFGFRLSTTVIDTGNWVYGAATYDGSNVKMYVNGVLETTTASTGNFSRNEQVTVGASIDDEHFLGNIAIARQYTAVLTGAQITQNYDAQKSRYGY